jgi:geranylgeranyl diphosphate synthase type II
LADLQSEMKRVKSRVDSLILEKLLPRSSPVKEIDMLYSMMRDYPQRPAKGLRPFICVTACKALGGRESDAMTTAACIELFQHWILIHDDIEDESEMRRGSPSLHVKYGRSLALNAGDALHARMWGILISNRKRLGDSTALRVMEEFSRMVNETTEGQHMELSWAVSGRWDLEENDYYQMVMRKTSWYTTASPSRLGAIIAGAPARTLRLLLDFGLKLGIGFQLQDDILNLTGDQSKYGKARSDDLLEGKRTLMLLRLIRLASDQERRRVVQIMAKPREQKTESDIGYVVSLMEKYGTIDYARKMARRFVDEAIEVADTIEWKGDSSSVSLLHEVARFAVERQW